MKTPHRALFVLAVLGLGVIAMLAQAPQSGGAAPKGPCLQRLPTAEETELAAVHTPWRYLYVPDTNPSDPLQHSAVLKATALGLAHDLAEGTLTPGSVSAEMLAERAIACGYPPDLASGGRGIALGGNSPADALVLMTSEQWGSSAGIRVPAHVNGLPMHCIGYAHVAGGEGPAGAAWVIVIMAGNPDCPQMLSAQTQPYSGATPSPSATFPTVIRPTKTPTPTATPSPTPVLHRLFLPIARD